MIIKDFKSIHLKSFLCLFVLMFPFYGIHANEEHINEKRIEVAMRKIGHEVLKCLGDHESRVLPIEKEDGRYRISFESEFAFDPDDIISITDLVRMESNIASHLLVEVEHCTSKQVVHIFEIGDGALPACIGRILPKSCYSLLVTVFENTTATLNAEAKPSENSSILLPALVALAFFALLFLGFYIKKQRDAAADPNLILIGASRFDKRNRVLSFENKRIELSHKEAELLSLLHAYANAPLKRDLILQEVWGDEGDYIGRTLDVFISRLRKKLEGDANVKIVNIRGLGYKLVTG